MSSSIGVWTPAEKYHKFALISPAIEMEDFYTCRSYLLKEVKDKLE
ncbi:hypothetical protein ABH968_004866 [Lysinibacillus sp. RC79]